MLSALRAMFTKNRTEITSEQVVQELVTDPDSPWHEYCGRGPITKNQVAALLRDYDIRPVVVHPTKRADCSRHGYRAAQFEDAFARFLPEVALGLIRSVFPPPKGIQLVGVTISNFRSQNAGEGAKLPFRET